MFIIRKIFHLCILSCALHGTIIFTSNGNHNNKFRDPFFIIMPTQQGNIRKVNTNINLKAIVRSDGKFSAIIQMNQRILIVKPNSIAENFLIKNIFNDHIVVVNIKTKKELIIY